MLPESEQRQALSGRAAPILDWLDASVVKLSPTTEASLELASNMADATDLLAGKCKTLTSLETLTTAIAEFQGVLRAIVAKDTKIDPKLSTLLSKSVHTFRIALKREPSLQINAVLEQVTKLLKLSVRSVSPTASADAGARAFLADEGGHLAKLEELVETVSLASKIDGKTLAELYRQLHTLKGNAGVFGFDALFDYTHRLEDMAAQARSQVDHPGLLAFIATAVGWIRGAIELYRENQDPTSYLAVAVREADLFLKSMGGARATENQISGPVVHQHPEDKSGQSERFFLCVNIGGKEARFSCADIVEVLYRPRVIVTPTLGATVPSFGLIQSAAGVVSVIEPSALVGLESDGGIDVPPWVVVLRGLTDNAFGVPVDDVGKVVEIDLSQS